MKHSTFPSRVHLTFVSKAFVKTVNELVKSSNPIYLHKMRTTHNCLNYEIDSRVMVSDMSLSVALKYNFSSQTSNGSERHS